MHGIADAPCVDSRQGGVRPGPRLGAALFPVVARKVQLQHVVGVRVPARRGWHLLRVDMGETFAGL